MGARKSVVIRLAGESGEGVISSGDILTQAAARGGYWTQTFRTYPAEIKGGPCMYQVRMGDEPIYSHGKLVDLLVCFNQEAWDPALGLALPRRGHPLRRDRRGDPGGVPAPGAPGAHGEARQGDRRLAAGQEHGRRRGRGRGDRLQHGAHRGAGAAPLRPQAGRGRGQHRRPPRRRRGERRPQGLAGDRGAGGGRGGPDPDVRATRRSPWAPSRPASTYFAGYPITPASDILEWLSAKLPQVGGHDHPVRGRDRLALLRPRRVLHRRQGDDGHLRPGPLADDRGAGVRRHGRDPLRDHRRPARRPVHRPADQDRAVRPAARPLRRPRRGAAGGDRADHGRGLLLGHRSTPSTTRSASRYR